MAFLGAQGQPGATQPSAYQGAQSEHRGVLSESSGDIIECVTDLLTAQAELPREDWGNLAWIKPCFGVWVYPGLLPLIHSLNR